MMIKLMCYIVKYLGPHIAQTLISSHVENVKNRIKMETKSKTRVIIKHLFETDYDSLIGTVDDAAVSIPIFSIKFLRVFVYSILAKIKYKRMPSRYESLVDDWAEELQFSYIPSDLRKSLLEKAYEHPILDALTQANDALDNVSGKPTPEQDYYLKGVPYDYNSSERHFLRSTEQCISVIMHLESPDFFANIRKHLMHSGQVKTRNNHGVPKKFNDD